ncbi:nucleotidyltransferase domain-containing protein [Segatella bryantii]|uniref:nucleotidyltransferase domain-containing protein n=1 Tax=Segatella bryantii TaxID=77095 RepID=UPI00088FF3FB|nr:nucleotidyltransferase family protein [Segatella bryantii]SDL93079.1 Uncharacterised nucleotidyltransferase [Segatella bryantii]
MTKLSSNTRLDDDFFKLLRLSLGLTQELPAKMDAHGWRLLYQMALRQSLVGVCYKGICLLPEDYKPPVEIAMQWACEAESIKGMNELLYQETARLTREFEEQGHRTAILKGQANARLYPDRYARQPGDIDIWVEGGKDCVLALLPHHSKAIYHHVHLPVNKQGVTVEVHFRPSSGNFNPMTNRRLQRWLEREILLAAQVEENFRVPSVKFALVMQLAHIQRHFLSEGIGLRHVCDSYWLLQHSTVEDRRIVSSVLRKFGLYHIAMALMWVLGEVFRLDKSLMLTAADSYRGNWLLREMMTDGNFGWYAKRQRFGLLRRVYENKRRHLRLMKFDFWEAFWLEVKYWSNIVWTLPTRIRYRKLSLRDFQR